MENLALIPKAASAPPMRIIYQHNDQTSWFENIAVRPNGDLLVTRLDAPEIYAVDPESGDSSVLVSFLQDAQLRSVMGITELTPDIWAVGVGWYDHAQGGPRAGSWEIWRLDLTGSKPATTLTAKIPEAGMINGLTTWNETTALAVDSLYGKVFRIDIQSGTYSVALEDPATMAPPSDAPVQIGINGVRARDGYVYYTNTTLMSIYRIPVDEKLQAKGPAETLAVGIVPDDFCFDEENEGVLFITGNVSNVVSKVTLREGTQLPTRPETFAGGPMELDVAGATACAFGRGPQDKRPLYVVTCGGSGVPVKGEIVEPGKVVAINVN
ncbi:putative hetero-Diels-Alderase [Paramyrothecium foliicola]|nr:putative hetero-Diels-Alderase [Paramyrothecium foliicola]